MKSDDISFSGLLAKLQEHKCSIKIEKLAETTAIVDCNERLWEMTGHLDYRSRNPVDGPRPLIKDLGYCIWRCRIGIKQDNWFYGKSIEEAISSALNRFNRK